MAAVGTLSPSPFSHARYSRRRTTPRPTPVLPHAWQRAPHAPPLSLKPSLSLSLSLFPPGTQWHPEKPPFEFSDRTIPKSHTAMSVSHYLADRFMDHARACPHGPASPEQELADLIYNTKPVFTAREIVMEASYDGESRERVNGWKE